MKQGRVILVSDTLAALGEPIRLRVLRLLEREELSVGELGRIVQLPQSTMSRHLKVLAEAGWTSRRSEGTATFYRLVLDDLPTHVRPLWMAIRDQLGNTGPTAELAEDDRRLASVLGERREDSQSFFGRVAEKWDGYRNELFGSGFTGAALLSLLPPDLVIADLGCGTGNAAELLAPHARQVIAVDQSRPMLQAAQRRLRAATNVAFVEAAIESLPLPSGSVDAAVAILVLHHVDQPELALREVARVLRPGGMAVIVDMVAHERTEYRQKMGHRWLGFSEQAATGLLAGAGLKSVRFRHLASDTDARGPGLFVATGRRGAGSPISPSTQGTAADGVEN